MDFKELRNIRDKAIELHSNGKDINEINQIVGMNLTPELLTTWWLEKNESKYKQIIFKLYKKQKNEHNYNKRKQILKDLKQKLEDLLKIIPDDIDLQTKLMYTYISLKQINEARQLGYKLLKISNSQEILNGVSIIEEKSGNYNEAIKLIDQILLSNPDNEFYKNKRKRLLDKNKNNDLHNSYVKIATLERSLNKLVTNREDELRLHGIEIEHEEIYREVRSEIYSQIKEIAELILSKQPDETIAKEKLIKSLYYTDNIELAQETANKFLKDLPNDEIILWYMCKIARDNGNLQDEKQYLERIINAASDKALIKNIMRLEKVNLLLEKQKEKEENTLQIDFTEEDRKAWIDKLVKDFKYGQLSLKAIDKKIKEARNEAAEKVAEKSSQKIVNWKIIFLIHYFLCTKTI